MSIKLYDDALFNKFNRWTAGTPLIITNVNQSRRLFETLSDTGNDKPIALPLIALSRPGGYSILNKNQRPASYNGLSVAGNQNRASLLNQIPIAISYQLDIYTRHLEDADEYMRNFIFNIMNYPVLEVDIPYEGQELTHRASIRINSEVEDNSDIPERLIPGQFTRFTLGLIIDDAYLWDVRIKDTVSITEIRVQANTQPSELVTLIAQDN